MSGPWELLEPETRLPCRPAIHGLIERWVCYGFSEGGARD
jgi:hypothetical protein